MLDFILIGTFALFLFVAFIYSSVGHAGASGYLAVMALLSFPLIEIKSTSLLLNIIVAAIASYKFISAGYFDKKVFFSFAATSIPAAFLGGAITLDPHWFKVLAGLFLLLSAVGLIIKSKRIDQDKVSEVNIYTALCIGAVIGLFCGLIGVGGGIFLSPLIILMGWTSLKKTSGIAALFILCNSITSLIGHIYTNAFHVHNIQYWIAAVVIGGFAGSHLGSTLYNNKILMGILFVVLCSAGLKFLLV
ncbi:sulfite exporter TauE/SafE family protein [Cytophaga aurantiaca]|uniref:sulfite exporter TauE/SafE family protein n=1 Tax=Cytophaga aurantiaca TaxID=29530 RepID=UPI00037C14C7|nr:sulfite exporter TauE/SafE family protein [Cytophaga aurantiaca]